MVLWFVLRHNIISSTVQQISVSRSHVPSLARRDIIYHASPLLLVFFPSNCVFFFDFFFAVNARSLCSSLLLGIVLATEKIVLSKMLVSTSNRRLFTVDLSTGLACSGFAPDGRQLVNQARDMCSQYKEQYGVVIPPNQLADRMSQYVHAHTCYHYLRPFGAACLMAGYDEDTKKHEVSGVQQWAYWFPVLFVNLVSPILLFCSAVLN